MKYITTTLLALSLIATPSFGGESVEELNVPAVADLNDRIGDAKGVILDNLPSLLENGSFSAYTVASYIFPLGDGENPEGFGGGIGVNYSFSENFELQSHLLWTNEDLEGDTYLIDFGPAYRYTFENDSSVYVRALLGYKTIGEDLYYGAALGATIPITEVLSVMVEPGVLLDYEGQNAVSVIAGVSFQF